MAFVIIRNRLIHVRQYFFLSLKAAQNVYAVRDSELDHKLYPCWILNAFFCECKFQYFQSHVIRLSLFELTFLLWIQIGYWLRSWLFNVFLKTLLSIILKGVVMAFESNQKCHFHTFLSWMFIKEVKMITINLRCGAQQRSSGLGR